jgi:hypothetical protein
MSATLDLRIDSQILRAGAVDFLDVWFINGLVAETAGVDAESEAPNLTLQAIRRLLLSGRLRAGDLEPPGEFVAWDATPDDAFERVRERWRSLGRSLAVGDVAWFRATP